LPQTEEDAEFAIGLRGLDVDFEFDPAADEELADFVLEREAELSYVQTRGTVARGSRTHSLTAGSGRSPREFRKKTEAIGLQGTVNHIEAVRFGAAPNPDLVATAIAQSLESRPEQDPMRAAFLVFRTSIQQANRDKAYFLSKLQRYNEIGNALSEHMRQLTDAMGSGLGCSDEDSGSRNVDTSILDPDHRTLADRMLVERAWVESDDGIRRTIRRLQQMEGQVRGRRQVVASQFENANQKSSQLYNMLSSVIKTMKEMEAGVIRNLR